MKSNLSRKKLVAALLAALTTFLAALAGTQIEVGSDKPGEPKVEIVFGQKLTPKGEAVYEDVVEDEAHADSGRVEIETPPAQYDVNEQAANEQTVGPDTPRPLAAREPVNETRILPRNWSSRRGARPALLVVHSTESSNVTGKQDLYAIAAWFSNPAASASSNYVIDAEGNVLRLVDETAKSWTQSYFNPWAVSIEFIGRAAQGSWPEAQLRAGARVFAASSAKWGIPVRHGDTSGCSILRSGILQHSNLGSCGGGHRDAGRAFPIGRFVKMVGEYRNGGYKPAPTGPIGARDWKFGRWYLGLGEYAKAGPRVAKLRPKDYPAKTPSSGWRAVKWYLDRRAS